MARATKTRKKASPRPAKRRQPSQSTGSKPAAKSAVATSNNGPPRGGAIDRAQAVLSARDRGWI